MTPMSKGSDHSNRGHSQGIADVSTSVPSLPLKPTFVCVEDIHPGITRDLSHQASCAVDKMLTYFLESILVPDEDHNAVSLFSDVRDAAVPIANKLRDLVEAYCEPVEEEIDRCAPFVVLVNTILRETEDLDNIPGQLENYTFLTAHLGLLAHRNAAKPIFGHYDNAKTQIIPDVVFTSLSAALRVSNDIIATWTEFSTSIAVEETPHLNFVWPDVLGSVEIKLQAHQLPPPPEQYTSESYADIPAVTDYAAETLPTSPITAHRPQCSQPSKGPVTPSSTSSHPMKSRSEAKAELVFNLPPVSSVMERSPSSEPQRPWKCGPPIVQTAIYAAERLGAGFASPHVINILIADGVFWIWYYDREGCIQTTGIDFTQDLPRLIVLLFAFQRFGLKHWGFHPDLDMLAREIHGSNLSSAKIRKLLSEYAPATENSDLPINTTVGLDDAKSVKLDFRTRRPIRRRHGLCGRATQVFSVSEILKTGPDDPPVEAERFILKAYWPDVTRLSEHRIIEAAYDVCSQDPDVTNHLPYVFGSRDDAEFNTVLIRTALAITPSSRGHCVLRLIVFEELYRLQDQPTSQIAMTMTLQAIKCHYALWEKDIHHTDISLDNIMVRRRRTPGDGTFRLSGVVNDWDLASTSPHGILERTGTVPYMHPELLTKEYWEGKVPRLYLHDNSSFIWVLAFLFLRYNKGKIIDAPTLPLDDLLTNDYNLARMIKRDIPSRLHKFVSGLDARKEWKVVVELLLWTSDIGRSLARISARHNPEKLAELLSADDARGVYNVFWHVVKNAAETNDLQYIVDMVPGVEGNTLSVAGEGGG